MIKAVLFDLYETLISEFANGTRKVPRLNDFQEQWGLTKQEYDEEWRVRQVRRMKGTFPDFPSVLRDMWQSKGKTLDEAYLQSLYQARLEAKKVPFDEISPNIIYMLKQLKSRGVRIGLISNCTEEEVRAWDRSTLAPYFDDAVFSYTTGYAKPDKEIYQLSLRNLKVEPREAIFVGDGGSRELDGAAAAGLQSFHATWFLSEHFSGKITGFEKLAQPQDLLERFTG
ncbi:HAD family hydrolase [Paenibacillus sp. NPDC056579]|uniref:HAD family hydrolase n=1 Tax=Paenibacillus sp. NPDC056579 TaxID=3345871 RepID=UPI0036853C74